VVDLGLWNVKNLRPPVEACKYEAKGLAKNANPQCPKKNTDRFAKLTIRVRRAAVVLRKESLEKENQVHWGFHEKNRGGASKAVTKKSRSAFRKDAPGDTPKEGGVWTPGGTSEGETTESPVGIGGTPEFWTCQKTEERSISQNA